MKIMSLIRRLFRRGTRKSPKPGSEVLSQEEIEQHVDNKKLLAEGVSANAYSVKYRGSDACLKKGFDKTDIDLFQHEASILQELKGVGGAPELLAMAEDYPLLVVSYCLGLDLAEMYANDHKIILSWTSVLDIFLGVAEALHKIHRKNIVHNDITFDNIMVQTEDGKTKIRIIDFGLARHPGESLYTGLATKDQPVYPWHDPEVYLGHPCSFKSDVYSLGCMMDAFQSAFPPADRTFAALVRWMTQDKAENRPCMIRVISGLREIKARLSKRSH